MPIILGSVINNGIQSGGAMNISDIQTISTNSKMNMQAAGGSFNMGNGNIIMAPGSGNLLPNVNDSDAADIS